MTRYSYHASQEQWPPSELLGLVRQAEDVGFDAAFTSDHLQPWSPSQGQSGFTWSWLGAALQATRRLTFGTITVPAGWRYHPVLLAQAIATLGEMFPGRLPWVALGSGQALSEQVFAVDWPAKAERNQRLADGAASLRSLLAGDHVTTDRPVPMHAARIWSRPAAAPRLIGAARSEATAEWVGAWADGLLTVAPDVEGLRARIEAFRRGGGLGKPVHVKVDVCWAASDAEAVAQAHSHWRFNAVGPDQGTDLPQPEDYVAATRCTSPEDMRRHVFITSDGEQLAERLRAVAALGVDSIDVHHVGADQRGFVERFGKQVLPLLRAPSG